MPRPQPYLRQLLRHRTDWLEERLYERAAHNGYGDITPAMARLFPLLATRPLGLSDLARRLGVSRQAVHKLALEAAALGYVAFIDSPDDARVKLLAYTDKGRAMARSAEQELQRIEARLVRHMGAANLAQLKALLAMAWSADEQPPRG
ncbi:MarR family transcriptional regulator [Ideonella sp. 4Y11]|uniref:MarR family transcriptional regulator n=1 Tax=Ideonella aquatica TaxID=2824119 RepID=A0A940YMU4_9BURK|nr:MarR family transcriptional regulator [Ideonella aquatica]MBQ0959812.1 MarR family transcriptional regulator [Ideonella aquatica]